MAWRMQEQAFGGLDRENVTFLEGLARHGSSPRLIHLVGTVRAGDASSLKFGQAVFLGERRKAELPHQRCKERFAREACWVVKIEP
jgi:hypothetical protein